MAITRPRILYVDNAGSHRQLVRDALNNAQTDVELVEAATKEEFVATLSGGAIDVVLTDLEVCGFHELEVLAQVRHLCPGLPVIIVTANGGEDIAVEAMGRLAGGVAHDFNNMLQVILGYATLAIKELGPSAEIPPWLTMIMEAASRSANLTRQLLAFTHVQPIEPQTVKIDDAIMGIARLLSRIIEEEVELTGYVAPGTWNIKMDMSQLDSVIANLVINARDAIAGAGKIDVRAENRSITADEVPDLAPGDYVMISVHDTGAGIAPQDIERVFEPFFTTKDRGLGNGVGLSSVQGIVRDNGGRVTVESAPNEGSTFSVFLPRYDAPTSPQHREPPRRVCADTPRRVLLVEDEEEVLRITERLLIDLGFQVVATRDPKHALELVQQNVGHLDLVMTDVVMPDIDGPTLVERLRTLVPEVPVLFTSGYPADTLDQRGVLNERVHFLPKPFSREKLEEKVAEVLLAGNDPGPNGAGDIE